MKLFISTLGVFDVKLDDSSLLKEDSRSYKLFKLFQYFLTFRNNKILPDTIIESLWPNHESYDPHNMLRAQIYRLRQLMKNSIPEDLDEDLYTSISFKNGHYSLDIGEKVTIDVEEFENLITIGDSKRVDDINSSIIYYEKAIDLYRGTYLQENSTALWLVPIKNHYRSLYIKTLFKLLDILKDQEKYQKIIEVCQNALINEVYNEDIHIYLMEAMLKLGQAKNAISHYEYTISLLNKDISSASLLALNDINRKIQNHLIENKKTDIINIKAKLEEESAQGPLICEFDHFKLLFNMEKRKRNIDGRSYITVITLNEDLIDDELKQWENSIREVLKSSLRIGDTCTFWNEFQIIILLQNVKGNGLAVIESRIKDKLQTCSKDRIYDIKIKSSTIMPQTSLNIFNSIEGS